MFCGVVVLYLCFGGTWVHVTTEKDLLKLNCICRGCCIFTCVLVVPGYML